MSASKTVSAQGDQDMEIIMTIVALVTGIAALGGAAINWGVDTRESYPDDHRR